MNRDSMNKIEEAVCVAVLGIVVMLLRGLTISLLWGWYVVPIGVVEISMLQGVGMALLLQCLTLLTAQSNAVKEMKPLELTVSEGVCISFILFSGYIYSLFL